MCYVNKISKMSWKSTNIEIYQVLVPIRNDFIITFQGSFVENFEHTMRNHKPQFKVCNT